MRPRITRPQITVVLSLTITLLIAVLSGCQLPGSGDAMAVEYQHYGELLEPLRNSALHQRIKVGSITTAPDFAPRAPTRMDPERIRAALVESLHRTGLLAAPNEAHYRLDVDLLRTVDSQVVADLTVTATMRYTLFNDSGAVIYSDTLTSDYSLDASDETFRLAAWERAYVGAVRNNLTALLRALLQIPPPSSPGTPTDAPRH